MNQKINFINFIKKWLVFTFLSLLVLFVGFQVFNRITEIEKESKNKRNDFLFQQKIFIKSQVMQVASTIDYELEKTNALDQKSMDEILEHISRIRFGKEGYVFVVKFNGDVLVTNGEKLSGKDKLWEVYSKNPERMKHLFQKEYIAAQTPNGDFVQYSFIKLSDIKKELAVPKLSFIYGIPKLQWLVGAGIYLEDNDSEIAEFKSKLIHGMFIEIFLQSLGAVIVLFFTLYIFEKKIKLIKWDLDQFNTFFSRAVHDEEQINIDNIKFSNFEEMAKNANKMLSEKIEVQQNFFEKHEQLYVTLRSIEDGLIATDIFGKIEVMNPIAENLTGWTLDEAMGKDLIEIFEIVNVHSRNKVINPVQKVINSGKIEGLANHTILIAKDKTEYQIADSAAPIHNNEGKMVGVVLVFRDVSEEYKMQNMLKGEKEKLVQIIEGTNAGTWDWNIQTGEVTFNERWANIIGYTLEELEPIDINTWINNIHPVDLSMANKMLEKVFSEKEKYYDVEFRQTHKNGHWVWVNARGKIIEWTEDKKPLRMSGTHLDITKRIEAEVALRENEERLNSFMKSATGGFVLYNSDFNLIEINKQAIKDNTFVGNRDDFIGKNICEIFLGIEKEDRYSKYSEVMNTGKPCKIDKLKFVTVSGTKFITENVFKVGDGLGIITTDLTEQMNAENSLRNIAKSFSTVDSHDFFNQVSTYLAEKLNVDYAFVGELQEDNKMRVVGGFGKGAILESFEYKLESTPCENVMEKSMCCYPSNVQEMFPKDHLLAEMNISGYLGSSLFDNSKKALGIMVLLNENPIVNLEAAKTTFKIFSNRVSAEIQRMQAEKNMNKFKLVIEQSSDAIFITDIDGKIIYCNPAFGVIYGYSKSEIIGKTPHILKSGICSREFYNKIWDPLLSKNTVKSEIVNKTKDKKNIDIERSNTPILDEDNKFIGFISINREITERKLNENALKMSKEKAENADKMKSIFLAQMSHEIRTPINAVVSMSSLLKYDFKEKFTEDQMMSFEIIERAGNRIIRTVDLLLNLSEIQAGTYEINLTKFDLFADIISQVIAKNRKLAEKKNLELVLNMQTKDTELISDSYTVNQIFIQLIDNAIKYTENGKVDLNITRDEFDRLVVEVNDTGIGIEKEYLPNLFKPFSQEEMGYTRKYEGNGIGLALVNKYCELNNATIEVESEKGVGSTFRVVFLSGIKK